MFVLQKFEKILKFFFPNLFFLVNIPNFIEEKDSEIKIGCYWGSGDDLFFFRFMKFFRGAKMGVPPISGGQVFLPPSLNRVKSLEMSHPTGPYMTLNSFG